MNARSRRRAELGLCTIASALALAFGVAYVWVAARGNAEVEGANLGAGFAVVIIGVGCAGLWPTLLAALTLNERQAHRIELARMAALASAGVLCLVGWAWVSNELRLGEPIHRSGSTRTRERSASPGGAVEEPW